MTPDDLQADPNYIDEDFIVGNGHVVSTTVMQKILDMHDGVNGQKKRTHDGLEKLYSWYKPYMIPRFRKRIQEGGTRLSKLKALDNIVYKMFQDARNKRQPVHGRMLQRWARQNANECGLDDFNASAVPGRRVANGANRTLSAGLNYKFLK